MQHGASSRSSHEAEVAYRFLHDRVQQAAYSLVPSDDRALLHYTIGLRLKAGLGDADLAEEAFDLCVHLNRGVSLSLPATEREDLARINIIVGQKAMRVTASRSALAFLVVARDLLGPSSCSTTYEHASACYTTLVDAKYANSDYASAQQQAEFCIRHVRTDLERLQLYSRSVCCATGTGDAKEAVRIGFEGLRAAGFPIPLDAAEAVTYAAALEARVVLDEEQVAGLASLPDCSEPLVEGAPPPSSRPSTFHGPSFCGR